MRRSRLVITASALLVSGAAGLVLVSSAGAAPSLPPGVTLPPVVPSISIPSTPGGRPFADVDRPAMPSAETGMPASPGQIGLDTANGTPAAPYAPDSAPTGGMPVVPPAEVPDAVPTISLPGTVPGTVPTISIPGSRRP